MFSNGCVQKLGAANCDSKQLLKKFLLSTVIITARAIALQALY